MPSAAPARLELSLPRRVVATAGALTGAAVMQSWGSHLPVILWLPTGLLLLSAVLLHRRHLGSQLLARAVLWANLILGAMIAAAGSSSERPLAAALAVGAGGALLALGWAGLSEEPGAFSPAAFRGTMIATMVMALADAQSLLLFGGLGLEEHKGGNALALACGLVLLVAVAGLYRLRVWGVLLSVAASVGVAVLAVAGALGLRGPVVVALCVTGAAQAVLPLPILAVIARAARGRPAKVAASSGEIGRRGWIASAAVIAALMTFSVAFGLLVNQHVLRF